MKKVFVLATMLLLSMGTVQAQGLLGKIKKAAEKVSNTVDKVNKQVEDVQNTAKALTSGNADDALPQGNAGSEDAEAKYQLHKTAQTKNIVVEGGVTRCLPFHDGMALVGNGDKAFFINDKFEKVFQVRFHIDYLGDGQDVCYENGRVMIAVIDKDNEYQNNAVIYDKTGKVIKEWKNVHYATNFQDGVAAVAPANLSAPIYVDRDGNQIFRNLPLVSGMAGPQVFPLRDGRARIEGKEFKWGYRDGKGNVAIAATFTDAHDFHEGLAAVKNSDEKWGFIDPSGKYVIDPIYSNEPGDFHSGLARVMDKEGRLYFIDKTGAFKFTGNADSSQALGQFNDYGYAIWVGENSYTMNTSFQKLARFGGIGTSSETREPWIQACGPDFWQVHPDFSNMSDLITLNGELLLRGKIGDFSEGYASYGRNYTEYGYTNMQGEIMVTFADTQF